VTQLRYCGMFNNYANANFQQSVPVKKNYNRSTCGKDMDNLVDSFLWPTAYISNDSGQLSLLSLRSRHIEYQPVWLGLKWGMFSCVGWHVTLCDLIWQATLRSSAMGSPVILCVVAGPPTIVQGVMTQTVNVDEGHNVNLSCAATGYPTPNISWVRVNGEALPAPYNRFAVKVLAHFELRQTVLLLLLTALVSVFWKQMWAHKVRVLHDIQKHPVKHLGGWIQDWQSIGPTIDAFSQFSGLLMRPNARAVRALIQSPLGWCSYSAPQALAGGEGFAAPSNSLSPLSFRPRIFGRLCSLAYVCLCLSPFVPSKTNDTT